MIGALLAAPTIGAACEAASVGRSSLARWLRVPLFVAELRRAESEAISAAARGLLVDLFANHAALREIRDSPGANDSVKVRAIAELEAAAMRWRNSGDIEARICTLEEKIKNDK